MRPFIVMALLAVVQPVAGSSFSSRPLTGGWQYIRGDMGSIWEVFRPIPAPGKPESVPLWTDVTLPHCFNATDAVAPDVNYYEGPGWYRTVLSDSLLRHDGAIQLEFEGAGQCTDVYLYTTYIQRHEGGYDEWQADLTHAIRQFAQQHPAELQRLGGIPLAIRCDNSRCVERIPSDMSDFNLNGGLYRSVNLLLLPHSNLSEWRIDTQVDEHGRQGQVQMQFVAQQPQDSQSSLLVQLLDAQGQCCLQQELTLSGDQPQNVSFQLRRPHLWDVDAPYLYRAQVTFVCQGDTLRQERTLGFRHFRFQEHGPFYLNGRRLLLQGTHRHEDYAGVAAAMTYDQMRTEMEDMKQMGVNFIRLGHYQQSRHILDLCDSLGILVWEEIPWCRGGLGGPAYQQQARRMLTAMIQQHRHHPSIMLWGMGNENDWPGDFPTFSQDSIRCFMQQLVDLSHQLDSSRLTCIRRCDFCRDIVDVYSPSIWAGWYSRKFTDFAEMEQAGFQSVPRFLHAEWGADSHAGRHQEAPIEQIMATVRGDANGLWDETFACLLFDWTLAQQQQMPWLTGSAIWTFRDFSTPLRPTNPIPYVNQKGLVERDGRHKESYAVVQSYWTDAKEHPMAHIYGHSWPIRWGKADEAKQLLVYSNCPEVELLLDGQSLGTHQRDITQFPAAGLHWSAALPVGPYTLVAIGRDARHHELCRDTLTQCYQTQVWGQPADIQLSLSAQPNGWQLLTAQVVDAQGIPCLECADFIEFGATDPQRLLTDQGTTRGSRLIQAANGRANILIRPGTTPVVVGAMVRQRQLSSHLLCP